MLIYPQKKQKMTLAVRILSLQRSFLQPDTGKLYTPNQMPKALFPSCEYLHK